MSMRLGELLAGIAAVGASADLPVRGLNLDSRAMAPGEVFVALRGTRAHGMDYVATAIARGAVAVLAEAPLPAHAPDGVPVIAIEALSQRLGEIAARFYGQPSRALTVIGVTGTNGKTSTVQMLAQALEALGHRAASIGTLGAGLHGAIEAGERTTPDAIQVQALLARFRDAGATHVAMEVSSHALVQGRVAGVGFDVAVFTNLSRDHLDYHGTMEAYGAAKATLFAWPGLKAAVVNVDDSFGRALAERLPASVMRLRVSQGGPHAELCADAVRTRADGLHFTLRSPWGEGAVDSALLGRFNVANLLAVAGTLGALGHDFSAIAQALHALRPVRGRMSRLGGDGEHPLLVVDYAHTPDALEQALQSLRAHCAGRLVCVFGCGGERDTGKRALMGAVAERLADVAIVTDDNPRGEDGDAIVAQILEGFERPAQARVQRDRAAAIADAAAMCGADDVILIAGKGHEDYQEVAGVKRPFDDLAVARKALGAVSC
ncbi:UDP-N-acetylmuramoyl-L-alanyl-D-glutamate--2,6-diaminopimelate ligase [Oleiagrimonas sp. C23AA]|uniref:UDP-N-acetylmuramoyl-L-alanyl-D-glutamate--2, 6-diaminopimelate ligase n=1 Tax=Oleiagrimonas sp. C23AA TaxID=2719047 RepID=UPI00141EFB80|nr:UDP-N-acetylmuramoyl-L-alanyl-D-glutamate--2,6-diaminopimelate ligase [Oleiagrimonas sp. C23AA]NII09900.1 UDP-N-acetylmuramoyl-L-alanyl-D-glutamate--2,6-diaminopimelate ligase [Oleiagrimonas sp. C23AA]